VRARQWSPELGAFLAVDEFEYHDAKGTLWSWPRQSPVRFRDPRGHSAGVAVAAGGIVAGTVLTLYLIERGVNYLQEKKNEDAEREREEEEEKRCTEAISICSEECQQLLGEQPRRLKRAKGCGGTNTQFQFHECFDDCMRKLGCKE